MNYRVEKKDDKMGLLDESNNVIIPFNYDIVESGRCENLYIVGEKITENKFKKGVYDIEKNKEIVPLQYDEVYIFEGDVIQVKILVPLEGRYNGYHYGILDSNGNEIIPPIWGGMEVLFNGTYIVYEDYIDTFFIKSGDSPLACYVLNNKGQTIKNLKEYNYGLFRDCGDRLFVSQSGWDENGDSINSVPDVYGMIDSNYELLTDFEYDDPVNIEDSFINGTIILSKDGESSLGVLDNNGVEIIPFQYEHIERTNVGFKCYEDYNDDVFDTYDLNGNLLGV